MMRASVRTFGFREVTEVLTEIRGPISRKAARRALYAAAVILRDEARSRAPVLTGSLRRAIMARTRQELVAGGRRPIAEVRIRPRTASAARRGAANPRRYAHLVEWGTRWAAAQPFMRPAFETKMTEAQRRFRAVYIAELEREAARKATRRRS